MLYAIHNVLVTYLESALHALCMLNTTSIDTEIQMYRVPVDGSHIVPATKQQFFLSLPNSPYFFDGSQKLLTHPSLISIYSFYIL